MRTLFQISILICTFFIVSCEGEKKEPVQTVTRIFPGYHFMLDEILRTKDGVFRGVELNSSEAAVRKAEPTEPKEISPGHLFYEYMPDSLTNFSIDYTFRDDSLQEINVQISSNDLELASYLFCDLKDYYANKLPNPIEDKGYVVYNCYEGQRKPFVVTLSDNSSPSKGIINMLIYKDQ